MHPRALDQRNRQAEERILASAKALAQGKSLKEPLDRLEAAHHNDFFIHQMLRREALADLMEAVATAQGFDTEEPDAEEADLFEQSDAPAPVIATTEDVESVRRVLNEPAPAPVNEPGASVAPVKRRGRPPWKKAAG